MQENPHHINPQKLAKTAIFDDFSLTWHSSHASEK
jgi:hypothetical protein